MNAHIMTTTAIKIRRVVNQRVWFECKPDIAKYLNPSNNLPYGHRVECLGHVKLRGHKCLTPAFAATDPTSLSTDDDIGEQGRILQVRRLECHPESKESRDTGIEDSTMLVGQFVMTDGWWFGSQKKNEMIIRICPNHTRLSKVFVPTGNMLSLMLTMLKFIDHHETSSQSYTK
ncbi:hypothetical protein CHS0354_016167 [Potamilus streckersoni]|uniref:Uncharacterized protein n=1 Tax=Potamilus streckersoni TaxID=2493646 RepID=A0AAE0RXB9_9BIVA|nr:hypothetical protein CHS0354_016167 [Potamilus streckersoni]